MALALTGCTSAEVATAPAVPSAGADAPIAPTAPADGSSSTPTPTPEPADADVVAALEGAATAAAMISLVEAGDLEGARELVSGSDSPLDWQPAGAAAWADEYASLAETRFWYLQLFDVDGPDEDELAQWLTATKSSLAAFHDAVESA